MQNKGIISSGSEGTCFLSKPWIWHQYHRRWKFWSTAKFCLKFYDGICMFFFLSVFSSVQYLYHNEVANSLFALTCLLKVQLILWDKASVLHNSKIFVVYMQIEQQNMDLRLSQNTAEQKAEELLFFPWQLEDFIFRRDLILAYFGKVKLSFPSRGRFATNVPCFEKTLLHSRKKKMKMISLECRLRKT